MQYSPAYYRARIDLFKKLIEQIPDDRKTVNNNNVLLRNGLIPAAVLNGKTEQQAVDEMLATGNHSNEPLTLTEKSTWNTWFAMHPEKQAGTEVVTTSVHFPITIKGTEQDIIDVLTPKAIPVNNVKTKNKTAYMLENVKKIMPKHQQQLVMQEPEYKEVLQRLELEAKDIPKWGRTAKQTMDEMEVHLHYFFGGSDWYILEWDRKNNLFFGYVILNGDVMMSELGSISVNELINTPPVELDFYWDKKPLAEVLYRKDPDYFPKPKTTKQTEEKQKRIRIAKVKAKAKLKILELETV